MQELLYGFSHTGNNIHLTKWFVKDHSPKWYLTKEVSKNGWTRIVASCGDVFRNDFIRLKDAHNYIKANLIQEVSQ